MDEEIEKVRDDYAQLLTKFDECRGCLARISEKLGLPAEPEGDKDWHILLIEQLDDISELSEIGELKVKIREQELQIRGFVHTMTGMAKRLVFLEKEEDEKGLRKCINCNEYFQSRKKKS